ncbi:hypothetical protein QBC34DRAFT_29438 [Podospora aff. communis PSN243]|uniref:F-box domain-containing protein n=1 Tax=Podospora aff. communis PSN243 TaxID=3040156 RepID=A0AAV9G4A0_9PEZI|nr:hypothetical protein QBC34DRAFT_29438 [Podospora aff. communis PSN243]
MENLAPELLALIVSELEPPLAPLAALSRQWQHAIEPLTFASLTLRPESEPDPKTNLTDLGQFSAAFSDPGRCRHLKHLEFRVAVPSPTEKRLRKLQGRRESALNDAVYTRKVVDFFSILARLFQTAPPTLSLVIKVYSLVDYQQPPPDYQPQHWHLGEPMWSIRNHFKYINFDAGLENGLARVPAVSRFQHGDEGFRNLNPAVISAYAAALPNVETMDWFFIPPPRRLWELRKSIRSSLADALLASGSFLSQLTAFTISWQDSDPSNQLFDPGSYIDPSASSPKDPLSIAMRRISQLPSLLHLKLLDCHTVSEELFGTTAENRSDIGTWPSLRTFEVNMALTTPDGRWYITGRPEDGEEYSDRSDTSGEEHSTFDSADSDTSDWAPERAWDRENGMLGGRVFRYTPDNTTLVPLLASMARAVTHMPSLRELELRSSPHVDHMSFHYYAPRIGPVMTKGYGPNQVEEAFHLARAHQPRWVIDLLGFNRAWKPPRHLQAAFDEVSGEGCVLIKQH